MKAKRRVSVPVWWFVQVSVVDQEESHPHRYWCLLSPMPLLLLLLHLLLLLQALPLCSGTPGS